MRTVVPAPRGDHLPLRAARYFLLVRLTGGFCHGDLTVPRQDVTSPFPSLSPRVPPLRVTCLHTGRFGTLACPPPPVFGLPWGPHPPGHQNYARSSASSSCSSGRNYLLSPWDSLLRFSLLTVDSRLRVGSWNSLSFPENFADPSATGKINCPSFGVFRSSFAFSLLGYVSDASNFSNSSISKIRVSSYQIPHREQGMPWNSPNLRSFWDFPFARSSWSFRR